MVAISKFDENKSVSTSTQLSNGSLRTSEKSGKDFMQLLIGKLGQPEAGNQSNASQLQSESLNVQPRALTLRSMENYKTDVSLKIDDVVKSEPEEKYPVEKEKDTVIDEKRETGSAKESADETETVTENKAEEKVENATKKETDASAMAAFLDKTFSSQLTFKVTPREKKTGTDKKVEIDLKLKNTGNFNVEKFMTKIENIIKKEFPAVNLADFKIELESFQKSKNVNAKDNLRADGKKGKQSEISLLKNSALAGKRVNEGEGDIKISSGENAAKTLLNKGGQKKTAENSQAGVSLNSKNQQADATGKVFEVKAPSKIDQASVIEQIKNNVGGLKSGAAENTYAIKMSLNPEALGRISLEIVLNDGGVTAKFGSENAQTHEMLVAASDQLKEMLGEKGIKVAKIEFSKDASLFAGGENLSGDRQNFNRNMAGDGGSGRFDEHQRAGVAVNEQASITCGEGPASGQTLVSDDQAVNMRI